MKEEAMRNGLPRHVFIIPDGNRRWARAKKKAPWLGHSEGRKRFHEISEKAFELGIQYFTFWAASEDNLLKREPLEVHFLVKLLKEEFEGDISERLLQNQIRLRVCGKWSEIFSDDKLSNIIYSLQKKTAHFENRHLTILLGYSGKTEIIETAKAVHTFELNSGDISFEAVRKFSWTWDLPPVDLEIRTGEERLGWSHRSSGALPFLTTDSVCCHMKTLWPDFSEEEFSKVLKDYADYERRFGA